jgi:single-stranded DNA-specific DHH superfamily exonuclease
MRRRFDVCNGDADGLCAVRQWRLHEPGEATLVTGLKREIALLQRVPCDAADEVLVCDLSMQRNRAALLRLLDAGVRVRYFDHHAAGDVPQHGHLEAHLDFGSEVCTSLLMDRHLGGRYRAWALVGAYGDDLVAVADRLAIDAGLDAVQRTALRWLGQAINYNAYGEAAADVLIAPDRLYAILARWPDPMDLIAHEPVVDALDAQRRTDLERAQAIAPAWQDERARVIVLPDAPWSRRVIGCLANELARARPRQAQAVLRMRPSGDYSVSVRAPRTAPSGASRVCEAFGGSGRAAAAGIDALPARDLERFIQALSAIRWGEPP